MLITQLCPTLCGLKGSSPPGSSVMGLFRQEYWSGLPFPFPGYLPNPGMEPWSPALHADSLSSESPGKPISYLREHSESQNIFMTVVEC